MTIRMATALALVVAGIACTPPARNFTDEQLKQVTSYDEIMWFMATQADPGFAYATTADPKSIPPEKVAWLGEIGRKMRGAAARITEPAFSKGAGHDKLAAEFGEKAKALEAAAEARDTATTLQATRSLKETCAACHAAYR
jgi:cytochrome c556